MMMAWQRATYRSAVRITVAGEEIAFDFAGSAPQVRGNINNSLAGLQATVLYALKSLIDPEIAANHGMLDPVRIIAPPGTVVNATFPAATAGRAQTVSAHHRRDLRRIGAGDSRTV